MNVSPKSGLLIRQNQRRFTGSEKGLRVLRCEKKNEGKEKCVERNQTVENEQITEMVT